jgi:hypothetical protein
MEFLINKIYPFSFPVSNNSFRGSRLSQPQCTYIKLKLLLQHCLNEAVVMYVCDVLKMKVKIFRLRACQHGVKTMKAVNLDDTARTHKGMLTSFIKSQVNVSSPRGGSSTLNLSVRYRLRDPRYADPWYGRGPSA